MRQTCRVDQFCFRLVLFFGDLFQLIAGLLLVSYVFLNQYIHGKLFLSLKFAIDTIFEISYCLFPLLYLSGDVMFSLSSLGILGGQNQFIFVQSFLAMAILTRKCIFVMRDLEPCHIANSYWRQVTRKTKEYDLTPWIMHKTFNTKNHGRQGFSHVNSELYRFIVAPFESQSVGIHLKLPRNKTIEIQTHHEDEKTRCNNLDFDLNHLSVANISNNNINGLTMQPLQHISHVQLPSVSVSTTPVATTPIASTPTSTTPVSASNKQTFDFANSVTPQVLGDTHEQSDVAHVTFIPIFCQLTKQQGRKYVIGGCGSAFITMGILILILFIGFIENDYKNKCFYNSNNANDSNSDEWFQIHHELKYFDTNCQYQVVHMFSNYPCNCRQYARYTNQSGMDEFSPGMVELVFLNYNNLQNIDMNGDPPESLGDDFYFTKDMLTNMQHLQIWSMQKIGISHIWSSEG